MERWTEEPAFPAEEWLDSDDPRCANPVRHSGMSLREYFAAKAMQSIVAGAISQGGATTEADHAPELARVAWLMADAMLATRKPPNAEVTGLGRNRSNDD